MNKPKHCVIKIGSYGPELETFESEVEKIKWLSEQSDAEDDFVEFTLNGGVDIDFVQTPNTGEDAQEELAEKVQELKETYEIIALMYGVKLPMDRQLDFIKAQALQLPGAPGRDGATFGLPDIDELLLIGISGFIDSDEEFWSCETDEVGHPIVVNLKSLERRSSYWGASHRMVILREIEKVG